MTIIRDELGAALALCDEHNAVSLPSRDPPHKLDGGDLISTYFAVTDPAVLPFQRCFLDCATMCAEVDRAGVCGENHQHQETNGER